RDAEDVSGALGLEALDEQVRSPAFRHDTPFHRNFRSPVVSGYLRELRPGADRPGRVFRSPDAMTRKLTIVTLVLCVALGAATTADAAKRFTIRGAGYGHGVGMSQYGAMGYALHGWD